MMAMLRIEGLEDFIELNCFAGARRRQPEATAYSYHTVALAPSSALWRKGPRGPAPRRITELWLEEHFAANRVPVGLRKARLDVVDQDATVSQRRRGGAF